MIHGVFYFSCTFMPIMGMFVNMSSGGRAYLKTKKIRDDGVRIAPDSFESSSKRLIGNNFGVFT